MKKFNIVCLIVFILTPGLLIGSSDAAFFTQEQIDKTRMNTSAKIEIFLTTKIRGNYCTMRVNGFYLDSCRRGASLESIMKINDYVVQICGYIVAKSQFKWWIIRTDNEVGRITVYYDDEKKLRAVVNLFNYSKNISIGVKKDSKNYLHRIKKRLEKALKKQN